MADTIDHYFSAVNRLPDPKSPESRKRARANFLEYKRLTDAIDVEGNAATRQELAAKRVRIGQRLGENYLRFVIGKARERTRDKALMMELISAGNEGIMTAVPKYDPRFNTEFLTYAGHWVRVKMDEVLHRLGTVRHSVHQRKKNTSDYLRGKESSAPADPIMTPIYDVQVADEVDVERDADPKGVRSFEYIRRARLTRLERFVVTLSLGLRGTPYADDEIALQLYAFDRTVMSAREVFKTREAGLQRLRDWLQANPDVEARSELS